MISLDDVIRIVAPIQRAVRNVAARAYVNAVKDSTKAQLLQLAILDGETKDEVERIQQYGFTSRPKAGAEAIVLFLGGKRDHGVAVSVDDRRYRIKDLEDGGVAVYNDTGAKIILKANGDIEMTPAGILKIATNVEVTGTLTASTDVVGGGKSLKNHTHSAGAVPGVNLTYLPVSGTPTSVTGETAAPS